MGRYHTGRGEPAAFQGAIRMVSADAGSADGHGFEERLVVGYDVVDFSGRDAQDQEQVVLQLAELMRRPPSGESGVFPRGTTFQWTGDGALAILPSRRSPKDALLCVETLRKAATNLSEGRPGARPVALRTAVTYGRVLRIPGTPGPGYWGLPLNLVARLLAIDLAGQTTTLLDSRFLDAARGDPSSVKHLGELQRRSVHLRVAERVYLKGFERQGIGVIGWEGPAEGRRTLLERLAQAGVGPSTPGLAVPHDLHVDPKLALWVDGAVELWAATQGPGLFASDVQDVHRPTQRPADALRAAGVELAPDFAQRYARAEVRGEQNKQKVIVLEYRTPLTDDPGLQLILGRSDYLTNTAIENTWALNPRAEYGDRQVVVSSGRQLTWLDAFRAGRLPFLRNLPNMVGAHVNVVTSDDYMLFIRSSYDVYYYPGQWQAGIGEQVDGSCDCSGAGSCFFQAAVRGLREELGLEPDHHYSLGRMELIGLYREVDNLNVAACFHVPLDKPMAAIYDRIPFAQDRKELSQVEALPLELDVLARVMRHGPTGWRPSGEAEATGTPVQDQFHPTARFRMLLEMLRLGGPEDVVLAIERADTPYVPE